MVIAVSTAVEPVDSYFLLLYSLLQTPVAARARRAGARSVVDRQHDAQGPGGRTAQGDGRQ